MAKVGEIRDAIWIRIKEMMALKEENSKLEENIENLCEGDDYEEEDDYAYDEMFTNEEKKIRARMASRIDKIENLNGANELFQKSIDESSKDANKTNKKLERNEWLLMEKQNLKQKKKDKVKQNIQTYASEREASLNDVEEIRQIIADNNMKIQVLYAEIKQLHEQLDLSIDWKKANSLTTEKRFNYFDRLASKIDKVPVYDPTEITIGTNKPYRINRRDKETFETCYKEARAAKIKLDTESKNKELGIATNVIFDIKVYKDLSNKERIAYCTKLVQQIKEKPITGTAKEKTLGKSTFPIDQEYSESFDLAVQGYWYAKRGLSCEIEWDKVERMTPLQKIKYFETVAENISKMPIPEGKEKTISCGGNDYTINVDYKDTFRTCYREAHTAEREIARQNGEEMKITTAKETVVQEIAPEEKPNKIKVTSQAALNDLEMTLAHFVARMLNSGYGEIRMASLTPTLKKARI